MSKARMNIFSSVAFPAFFPKQVPSLCNPSNLGKEPLINLVLSSGAALSPTVIPILHGKHYKDLMYACAKYFLLEQAKISIDELLMKKGIIQYKVFVNLPRILEIYSHDFVQKSKA